MAEKHPVTALQELAKSKELAPPIYCFEEIEGPKFKCTVQIGGKTFEGIATAKRLAKHECAQIALEKLQIVEKPQKTTNYIGELNVFASKNHVDYPVYECFATTKTGEFIVNCSFLGCQALGKGQNQKEAKQNAARNMLELYVSKGKCELDTQKSDEEVETVTVEERSGSNAKVEKEENENNSEKSEVIGWGAQDLEFLTRIKTLGINKEQVVQKNVDNEEDNKNLLEEETGDISNKKNKAKAKKKKNKKGEVNFNEFGIPHHVTGVNTGQQIQKKDGDEYQMESVKEESGIISKAKKEESNKSVLNGLGAHDLAKIIAGINTFALNRTEEVEKEGNKEDNKNVEEEENSDVSKDKKTSVKAKTKKKESKNSEGNDFGVQDLANIVTGINSLGLNTGGENGKMKTFKEEGDDVSQAKKKESNKSKINGLGVQDLAKIIAGVNIPSLTKDNKKIVEEESGDTSNAKEDTSGTRAKAGKEENENNSEKSEVVGWGAQELEEVFTRIKTLGIYKGQVVQKNDNEEDDKNILEEESGDVSKKNKTKKKKSKKKNEVNFRDVGIQNLISASGVNSFSFNTGETIRRKGDEEGKMKTVKEESGVISKAKEEEGNKSVLNALGVQDLAESIPGINTFTLDTREDGSEEDNKNIVEEKSTDFNKAKKKAAKASTKKKGSKNSEGNGFGIQDFEKVVTEINSLITSDEESKMKTVEVVAADISKAKKEESNKSLGIQDLAKIIAGMSILSLKKDNEDQKKNVEEESGDVSKAKKKAINPNGIESKKNVVDDGFGIQDLEKFVAGIDREDIQKTSDEEGKKKTVKVVKAKKKAAKTKKDENNKSEVNDLGVLDPEKIFPGISTLGVNIGENIQEKGDEEGKKKTVKEESDEVGKGKKKAAKAKNKKEEIKKNDVNGLGVQDIQKIVAGINRYSW